MAADIINDVVACEEAAQDILTQAQEKKAQMLQRLDKEIKNMREHALSQANRKFEEDSRKAKEDFDQKISQLEKKHTEQLLTLRKTYDEKSAQCVHTIFCRITDTE